MSNSITVKDFMRQDSVVQSFRDVLGEREANAYISSVLIAVANSQTLQECTPISIMSSALRAATLRLSCDPGIGQAYLVPFKGRCTLIIGYKGIKDMALRTNQYRYLHIAEIFEGETVDEDRMTGKRTLGGGKVSNETAGWLLYFELVSGFCKWYYMTVEEIAGHAARYSKSINRPDSAWKTNLREMQMKTVLRQGLTKWGVFDPHDSAALVQLEEEQGYIDAELSDVQQPDIQPAAPKSELELLSELGFDAEPPPLTEAKKDLIERLSDPTPEPIIPSGSLQPWEMSSDGVAYDEIPSDKLAYHLNGIIAKTKKPDYPGDPDGIDAKKVEYIKSLLTSRAGLK
jgi:recombination protein RecT